MPTEGTLYYKQYADLNGNGQLFTVGLRAYNADETGYFGQLVVVDSNGSVIWEGPQAEHSGDDAAFGVWHYGTGSIQIVADIDGDGRMELVSAVPVSDLRPPAFRVWRWNGEGFDFVFSKCLVERGEGSGNFVWTDAPYEYDKDSWIGALNGQNLLELTATVSDTHEEAVRCGEAQLMATESGFMVTNWVKPLQ